MGAGSWLALWIEQATGGLLHGPCGSRFSSTRGTHGPWTAKSHDPAAHLRARHDRSQARLRVKILRFHDGGFAFSHGKPCARESLSLIHCCSPSRRSAICDFSEAPSTRVTSKALP